MRVEEEGTMRVDEGAMSVEEGAIRVEERAMRVEHVSKIGPCLWFDDQAEQAADFYVKVFSARRATAGDGGESKILGISRYGEAGPGPAGTVMTVDFLLEGQEFVALNGGPEFSFTPAISFIVNCETQDEVDGLWETLSAGWHPGRVRLAGGQVRRVVADRPHGPRRPARRPRSRTHPARDARDARDAQARHRRIGASRPGRVGRPKATFSGEVPYPRPSEARGQAPRVEGGLDAQEPARGDAGARPAGRRGTGRHRRDGDGTHAGRLHRYGLAVLDRLHILDDVGGGTGVGGRPDRHLPDHRQRQRAGLGRPRAVPNPQHERGRADVRQQPRRDALRTGATGPSSFSFQWVERDDVASPHANFIRLQWRSPSGDQVSMLRGDMAVLYRTDGCDGSS